MKIVYLILPLLLVVLPSCYRIKFDNEFNHLNSLTTSRTQLPLNLFSDPLEEQKINQMLIDGITRDDAIEIALKNNKKLQALFQSLGISKSDVIQSSLFTNPSISVKVLYPNIVKQQQSENQGLKGTEIFLDSKFKLSDLWLVALRENISRDKLELHIYKILNEILETIKAARKAYDNILYSKSYLEYGDYIKDELEKIEKNAYKKNDKDKNKTDKQKKNYESAKFINELLVKIHVAKLKFRIIIDHKAKIASSYARLRDVLGIESPTSEKINIKDDMFNMRLKLPKIEDLLEMAYKNHPDIFTDLLNIKKAQDSLKYEEARIVKDTHIGVASVGPDPILTGAGPSIESDVPVLDQNQAQRSRAYYEFIGAQKDLEATKIKIAADIYSIYEKLIGEMDKVDVYKHLIKPFAQDMIKSIDSMESDQVVSEAVYLNVKFDVYDIYLNYTDALKEFLDAFAELERAVGQRLDIIFDPKYRVIKKFDKKVEASSGDELKID